MTKWIKLQSSVGSRAVEEQDEMEEEEAEWRCRERQKERGKKRVHQAVFFTLIFLINSPPSSSVQSRHTPKHHPGLYAVMSQLALEESAVRGIIISHSTKAVEQWECQMHAGSRRRRCIIMNAEPKRSSGERKSVQFAVAIKPVWNKQLINLKSSFSSSCSWPCWCWGGRGLQRIDFWALSCMPSEVIFMDSHVWQEYQRGEFDLHCKKRDGKVNRVMSTALVASYHIN